MGSVQESKFTGMEIGTSTIKVAICSVDVHYRIRLLGWGEVPSIKVVKGDVKDQPFVSEQIARAIEKAESQAGVRVVDTNVYLLLPGGYVHLVNTSGCVELENEQVITPDHLVLANREGRYQTKDSTSMVIQTFTKEYRLDEDRVVRTPVGLRSSILEAHVVSIVAKQARIDSFAHPVIENLNRSLNDVIYTPLSLSYALWQEEGGIAYDGCLIIDIGAGVTSYALIIGKDLYTVGHITVGCDHAANDLSVAFALPIASTRKILRDFQRLNCSVVARGGERSRSRFISADQGLGGGSKMLPASSVEQIVHLRFQELFGIINKRMNDEEAWSQMTGGILLCGGGARLPGMCELAELMFRHPVEVVCAVDVEGSRDIVGNPANVSVFGAIRQGRMEQDIDEQNYPGDACGQIKKFFKSLLRW